jgi:hypothetical protein
MPPSREGEARAFYDGLLGIPEVPKPPHLLKRERDDTDGQKRARII